MTAVSATRSPLVGVIGAGRDGLVLAACLAQSGHVVSVADADAACIAQFAAGRVGEAEPGLHSLVEAQIAAGRLAFTTDIGCVASGAAVVFVSGAARRAPGASFDTDALEKAVMHAAAGADADAAVAIVSGMPPGTAARLQQLVRIRRADIGIVSLPMPMRDGRALRDVTGRARVVIGVEPGAEAARERVLGVIATIVPAEAEVIAMDTRSAELTGLAAGAQTAARVSFINEIAAIAGATGADIVSVCAGLGGEFGAGPDGTGSGQGYGGSRLPRDVATLTRLARGARVGGDLLVAIERVNERQRAWPVVTLMREIGSYTGLRGLRVAIWGLAHREGSDDVHDAASVTVVERLRRAGASVHLYDPMAMEQARVLLGHAASAPGVRWCDRADDALIDADVLMVLTACPEFARVPPELAAERLSQRTVYDGRHVLDARAWERHGVRVVQFGRPGPADDAAGISIARHDEEQRPAASGRHDAPSLPA